MADIELVIKIDEEVYKILKSLSRGDYFEHDICGNSMRRIANGTPLPKGHGDLIDKSKICKAIPAEEDNCTGIGMTFEEMDAYNDGINAMYNLVRGAKAIIEADKESEGYE